MNEAPLEVLRPWIDEKKLTRVLLLCGPSRRFLSTVMRALAGLELEVFDGAQVHVPASVVTSAREHVASFEPDLLISLGGGAATGLAKALRLESELPFVAIPTTYSGSEGTNIYGVTHEGHKETGRDERVRPDLVIRHGEFVATMPRQLTVLSLMNALAHPLSALSTGELDDAVKRDALGAVHQLSEALRTLAAKPMNSRARRLANDGSKLAARVLDAGQLGAHHKLAHGLGGALGADHAALHALLLPHSSASLLRGDEALASELVEASRCADLPGELFEHLKRVGAKTSLASLCGAERAREVVSEIERGELPDQSKAWAHDALFGRNPSLAYQELELGDGLRAALFGAANDCRRVVVAVHGRGACAESIAAEARALTGDAPDVCILAPQAPGAAWYSARYSEALSEEPEAVDRAMARLQLAIDWAIARVGAQNTVLFGFSQGACLALEYMSRCDLALAGVVALSGARLGDSPVETPAALAKTPMVLGISRHDRWVDVADLQSTAQCFRDAGANVTALIASDREHAIRPLERWHARPLIDGRDLPQPLPGFGNAHESEALDEALPRQQNTPRKAPYSLYPEQINGTGFVKARAHNLRSWLYRIRPSAQRGLFEAIDHPHFVAEFDDAPEPNLCGWGPLPSTGDALDFVDGIKTIGGAGHPALRRGYAIHLYEATVSMNDRAFYDADGDLLLVPQRGALCLQTELGVLELSPGQVAVVPRGILFSVQLRDAEAYGYLAEVYGRHFELPHRGPVGANALADARHFLAPAASFEDRLAPGYRITARHGGRLFEATQDFSPYDVVAWHGNYAPYVYDLGNFSPVGNTAFDHPDPSIHTVLSAPLDEEGSNCLDFVFFAPRWDPTEHTFRPPFFHRNATTEINGIIDDPGLAADSMFQPGCLFVTPSMTAHGVLEAVVEKQFSSGDEEADRPARIADGSMWFQFESALPFQLSSWARDAQSRICSWSQEWGNYRSHFRQ